MKYYKQIKKLLEEYGWEMIEEFHNVCLGGLYTQNHFRFAHPTDERIIGVSALNNKDGSPGLVVELLVDGMVFHSKQEALSAITLGLKEN